LTNNPVSSSELLNYAAENGMIDLALLYEQIEMQNNQKYLAMHPYKIWHGKDDQWHTYLPDKEKGRVPRHRKTEKELKQVIIEYWRQESENPTVKEVFEEWNNRRLELKQIEPATYDRNQRIFNRHYTEFGKNRIKALEPEDIEEFLEEQIAEHDLTAKAFANLKTITRGFLKRAKKRKLIQFQVEPIFAEMDWSESNFKKVIKEDFEEVFDEEETDTMIYYLLQNLDTHNIGLLLIFITGLRVGELATLKHEDFAENAIKIRRTETKYKDENGTAVYAIKSYPKTKAGVRTVLIPDDYTWILTCIEQLNPDGDFVFVNSNGERMTTNCFRKRLERICAKLEIYPKSPHKIRKTYISILLDNHVDRRMVTDIAGHTDIRISEDAYHRNRRSLNNRQRILSNIPDFKMPANIKIDTLRYQKVSEQNAEKP